MISTYSRSSLSRSARQGFSLIEVAIALVIFVIGALAIIRIFPGALSVIGNNGDQQLATNLNRSVAARLQSENAVPYANFNIAVNADGTLRWTTANNTNHTADFGNIDASVIGVPRFNNSLPTPEDINTQTNNSALSRFRGIQGEQVEVTEMLDGPLIPSTTFYLFTQFPISIAKINGGDNDTLLQPTLSQDYVIQNARIDKQGRVTFKDATIVEDRKIVRLDDTNEPKAVVKNSVPAQSMIYVSYRYYNTSGQIWSVNDEAVPVATAIPSLTDPLFNITANPPTTTRGARELYDSTNTNSPNPTGTIAEIIDVRVKRYIGVGKFGPPSSPEVSDADYPNIEQKGDARLGIVRLDALTNNLLADTPKVGVDYIADWSFLLQEGVPLTSGTTPNARQIALGAPFIEDQEPVGIYSFLMDPSVISHPQPFRSQFGSAYPAPDVNNKLVVPTEDELRAGKATFIVTPEVDNARVAYQTRDRWVQQLSVAANAYKPFVASGATGASSAIEPWRDYFLGADNYLYFHAGEAGKTISVSYRTTDDNGPLVDRPFVIETQLVDAPQNFYNGLAARVKLTDANGNPLPPNTTGVPNLVSIQAVKGTSVTVRTAYINGSKYVQTLLTSNRGANS